MTIATLPMNRLQRTQMVPRPSAETFEFFSDISALEAITPPFLHLRVLTPAPIEMAVGTRIEYALTLYGVPIYWRTLISEWVPGERFVDEQEAGPFAHWRHLHEFTPLGGQTLIRDVVEYAEPFGPIGRVAHQVFVARTLERIFDYRRDAVASLLPGHAGNREAASG